MPTTSWGFWRVALLVLSLVLLATPAVVRAAAYVRVKAQVANVREGPGTRFSRLWRGYENDPLEVVGREGRWLKVEDFEGHGGWIYARLTDGRPAVIVNNVKTWANIRSGPGLEYPVTFTADRGVSFRVVGKRGDWLRIQHADGDRGWIAQSLVWGTSTNKTGTAKSAHPTALVRVKVAVANIREGPGTSYERLWKVGKNYPLEVVAREGRWVRAVDFEGYDGWVFGPLTDTQSAVIVKADRANIRSGPGKEYRVVVTEVAGVAFRVHDRKGRWLRVEHADGHRGWIHDSLVWGH